MKRLIFGIILIILIVRVSEATNYYVDSNKGSDLTGNGTQSNPWKTVTHALQQITGTGHTIRVAQGTYNTALGEVFPIRIKNGVSLIGAGAEVTMLDADSTATVIKCVSIIDTTTKIEGFTIKTGTNKYGGGGILITAGSALKIINNIISDNCVPVDTMIVGSVHRLGGGIYVSNSSPMIVNNTIENNWVGAISIYSTGSGGYGGGIAVTGSSSPTIRNNVISNNSLINTSYADACGGGIYVSEGASPIIINNTISGNKLRQLSANSGNTHGGGIYVSEASYITITQNKISNNTSSAEYGSVKGCSGIYVSNSQVEFRNNIIAKNNFGGITLSASSSKIFNNTITENDGDGIYLENASSPSVINNIISHNTNYGINERSTDSDPLSATYNLFYYNEYGLYFDENQTEYFNIETLDSEVPECNYNLSGDPSFVAMAIEDYHLRCDSPAIDAGDPSFDYSNEPEPNGDRINIGAYGNTPTATTTIPKIALPNTIDFGNVLIDSSQLSILEINNVGRDTLIIYDINWSLDSIFMLSDTSCKILPFYNLDIIITFRPKESKSYLDSLIIISNDPEEDTSRVYLSGNGVTDLEPEIALSYTSLNFGEVLVYSPTDSPLVIGNSGTATLVIYDINWSDPAFSVKDTFLIIPVDNDLRIPITFTPPAIGSYADTLIIICNDPDPEDDTSRVYLFGNGELSPPEKVTVLPNVITPNNDGYNDYVEFKYPNMNIQEPVITIFNRRGRKVRELRNFSGDIYRWYGKDDKGKVLEPGIYIYILEVNGKIISRGTITIML